MKKVLIGGAVLLMLIGAAAAGFLVYYGTGVSGPSPDEREEIAAEGKRFAEGREEKHCIIESMARLDCGQMDIACMRELDVFVVSCLKAADKTEGFCSPVPSLDAAIEETDAFLEWASSVCEDAGHGADNSICHEHLKTVAGYCG